MFRHTQCNGLADARSIERISCSRGILLQRTYSRRHVIEHQPAKFHSNRTIGGGVMTSYRFFKMAAIKSEMYFRDDSLQGSAELFCKGRSKSIGNGTFRGIAAEKPLNRLTQNLAWMITSGTRLSTPNGMSIGSGA